MILSYTFYCLDLLYNLIYFMKMRWRNSFYLRFFFFFIFLYLFYSSLIYFCFIDSHYLDFLNVYIDYFYLMCSLIGIPFNAGIYGVIFFVEPSTKLFHDLIQVHDVVCMYLVTVLVFVYWMLYCILTDHVWHLKSYNKINFKSKDTVLTDDYYELTFIYRLFNLNSWVNFLYRDFIFYYNLFFKFWLKLILKFNKKESIFSNILKKIYLMFYYVWSLFYILCGFQYSKDMRYLNNFYFILEDIGFGTNNFKICNNYNLNNKLLFSGCNSNILSLHGKFIEMEEASLLTKLSFNSYLNNYIDVTDITINNNILLDNRDIEYFFLVLFQDIFNHDNLIDSSIIYDNTITQEFFYDIFNDDSSSNNLLVMVKDVIPANTYISTSNNYYNRIMSLDHLYQDSSFYKRRLNDIKMSYYFNPYIDSIEILLTAGWKLIFDNDNLYKKNDNNNFISVPVYSWKAVKYYNFMLMSRLANENLNRLSYGINLDIIIQSWEYHHSESFEYTWAGFPTIIILSIINPSYMLLYQSTLNPEGLIDVIVMGHQWYWTYILSTDSDLEVSNLMFESHLISNNDMFEAYGSKRLLSVDKHLMLMAHVPTKFFISSTDVLHAFAVPSMGIKVDAIPGRINTFYLVGSRVGVFYGQCSELCGFGHGFMPIVIEMVADSSVNDSSNSVWDKFKN